MMERYGHWTVLRKTETTGRLWCRCDCGYECSVRSWSLSSGRSTQCKACASFKGHGKVGMYHHTAARRRSVDKSLDFDIDTKYMSEIYESQNRKCALSGLPIAGTERGGDASLDRIDSSKGYIRGNVQWVDKRINNMKQALPEAEFIELCRLVFLHKEKQDGDSIVRSGPDHGASTGGAVQGAGYDCGASGGTRGSDS